MYLGLWQKVVNAFGSSNLLFLSTPRFLRGVPPKVTSYPLELYCICEFRFMLMGACLQSVVSTLHTMPAFP